MSTITQTYPSLVEVVRRLNPNGSIATIAEHLAKLNPILDHIPWVEGNLPTGHRVTGRTALPAPTYRKLNEGVDGTMSKTTQYDEVTCMLEAYSKIDVDLCKLNGNTAEFRASEEKAFVESFNQELVRAFLYESTAANPERMQGLSPRYTSSTTGTNAGYVFKGTNSGVNCQSVWLISWDPDKVFGIFPKGSQGGLSYQDLGQQLVPDSANKQFLAYVGRWQWKPGLCVRDYRYNVRMQWDPDDTTNFANTATGLMDMMGDSLTTVYQLTPNARFYMSRKSFKLMQNQLKNKQANYLEWVDAGGKRVAQYLGVPVTILDALVDESAVS